MNEINDTDDGRSEQRENPTASGGSAYPTRRTNARKTSTDAEMPDRGGSRSQPSAGSEALSGGSPEIGGVGAKARVGQLGAQVGDATVSFEGQVNGGTVEILAAAPSGPELTSARLGTDAPSSTDELGFLDYARAIARFLTHSDSTPPLTISIQAPWGGGKSSLMRMIQNELDASKQTESSDAIATVRATTTEQLSVGDVQWTLSDVESGSEPALPEIPKSTGAARQRVTVWFNAWKYESTNQVWAGLIDAILQQVPERLPWKERERFWALLNIKRIGVDHIRQRFYEHVIGLALRTSVGTTRATLWAVGTAIVFFGLHRFAWFGQSMQSLFGWMIPIAFVNSFVLTKWNAAKSKASSEPVADVLKDLVDVPKYEEQLGFVHQVERDLKRVFDSLPLDEGLVIFIDDLDRCTPTKIAAVLEAINLFLAGDFRSCSFVIGMDTEMVAAALQVAHKDLVDKLPDGEATPLGWRFMDKFVQLPFVIPPLTGANRSNLMFRLLGSARRAIPATAGTAATVEVPGASFDEEAEKHLLLKRDSEAFVALATLGTAVLNPNPRELKRFINLLRFNYFLRFSRQRQGLPVPPTNTLASWTALSVKWPEHARWLRHVRDRGIPDETLAEYIPEADDRDLWHSEPNHLFLLETLAKRCARGDGPRAPRRPGVGYSLWRSSLTNIYGFADKTPAWLADGSLLDFYAELPSTETAGMDASLSGNRNTGFW